MNIIETAKNRDEIMASQQIHCPRCGNKQFSPFDKLYTKAYDICVDCTEPEELELKGNNIFAII